MELLERDSKVEEEKEDKEEGIKGKKIRWKGKIPSPDNKLLMLIAGGALFLLFVINMMAGKQTVITSSDAEVVDRVMKEQLKLQKELQRQLLEEIKSLRKEVKEVKNKSSSEVEGQKPKEPEPDLSQLIKERRKQKTRSSGIQEEELRKLKEELERLKRGSDIERMPLRRKELKIQVQEVSKLIDSKKRASPKEVKKKKKVFIPAGSVMRGRVVSAFFAPVGGERFPAVLLELQGNVSLPNGVRFPVHGCRIIAKAEGDWVLERARLETYKLACVLPDGKVIEKRFKGKVVSGLDGGEGIKGQFINASAKQLKTYFATSFLGTLFQSLARAQVYSNIASTGGAVFRSEVIKNDAQYALYSALAKTWQNFSQFYLKQAKKALPVVLVDGNIPVYVEVIDGFSLGVSTDEVASLVE